MENLMAGTIQNKVPELMARRRWNITDLARAMGVSNFTAGRLYHGQGKAIAYETLAKLCEALEAEPGEILVYTPEEESSEDL